MNTYTYKLCLFGPGGVGKTTLTRRYLTGLFEENTKLTMGASEDNASFSRSSSASQTLTKIL